MTGAGNRAYLIYDAACPFCEAYVRMIELRDSIGPVELISARTSHPLVESLRDAGYKLDEEMVLVIRDRVYAGPDCMTILALSSSSSTMLRKINKLLFSSARFSRATYPILRAARRVVLRGLGIGKIR